MSSQASSKRRKSRRKSSSKKKSFAESTIANDGINFFALLLGLTAGATFILLMIGIFKKPAINPEILAADQTKIGDVAATVKRDDFKTFVQNASTEKLAETLDGLNLLRPATGSTKFISTSQRKILVADQMMTRTLDDQQRLLAASSKIQTLATMFWADRNATSLGVSNLEIRLREATKKFVNDADRSLSRIARLERAALNSLTADRNISEHARELYGLLKDFPEDKKVAQVVYRCLSRQIAKPESIPVATKLADAILRQPKIEGTNTAIEASAWSRISDLWLLCDRGFFDLNAGKEIAGPAGLERLTEICIELLDVRIIGEEGVGQIEIAANWLEQNDHYDLAQKIYSSYLEKGPKIADKRITDLVLTNGRNGTKRCEAIGKPFSLKATTLKNQPINVATFDGQPVLLVYWSSEDNNVQQILRDVEKASIRWRRGAVKIITVQVEKNSEFYSNKLAQRLAKQHPTWDFCVINPDGTNPLFDQLPSKRKSRLALLDREHRLLDVDILIVELPTIVNAALAARR